jgi:diguanylate cyclase
LRDAIRRDELTIYLQPQVSLDTRSLEGVEALVRWQHPKRGLVFPDQFISVAESTGLIRGLTHWVLNAALREIHNLAEIGIFVPVSVNFSMRDLHDADLPHTVESLLARWSVHPAQLTVEITESSLMDDPPRALQTIRTLSSMGVRISIDDFGTGFSSLSYLKQLPVDELKIDRSFVQHLANDKKDAAIVRSTIGLAHDLGLQVVAEGIEDMDTWTRLRALKCDTAQGYFISRPMPAQQLPEWVREQWHAGQTLAAA